MDFVAKCYFFSKFTFYLFHTNLNTFSYIHIHTHTKQNKQTNNHPPHYHTNQRRKGCWRNLFREFQRCQMSKMRDISMWSWLALKNLLTKGDFSIWNFICPKNIPCPRQKSDSWRKSIIQISTNWAGFVSTSSRTSGARPCRSAPCCCPFKRYFPRQIPTTHWPMM